eukprot:1114757-Pelagomonas_calceolata.AAC.3
MEPLVYGLLLIVKGISSYGRHPAVHAWPAAGGSCCCPRHCISMPPLSQEGLAAPIFQRRLRHSPHLSYLFCVPCWHALAPEPRLERLLFPKS